MLPVAFCTAAAHSASVFALSAGAVSFGQIVKASEPAFAAVIGTLFYGGRYSLGKWLCLVPVIGGVVLASVKELDFAVSALVAASLANVFAAVKGSENGKLIKSPVFADIGSVGNQFAVTMILAFLISVPVMLLKEGDKLGEFITLYKTNPVISYNLVASGLTFYAYNELATMTIKKTGAVTASVANTAKRVIVMVYMAAVTGKVLTEEQKIGAGVAIGGAAGRQGRPPRFMRPPGACEGSGRSCAPQSAAGAAWRRPWPRQPTPGRPKDEILPRATRRRRARLLGHRRRAQGAQGQARGRDQEDQVGSGGCEGALTPASLRRAHAHVSVRCLAAPARRRAAARGDETRAPLNTVFGGPVSEPTACEAHTALCVVKGR